MWSISRAVKGLVSGGQFAGFMTPMTFREAVQILSLPKGWRVPDAHGNYRALLLRNHPDRGGSEYIAQKLNEARELVLSK